MELLLLLWELARLRTLCAKFPSGAGREECASVKHAREELRGTLTLHEGI